LRDGGGTEILDPTIYHQRGEKEENPNKGKKKGSSFKAATVTQFSVTFNRNIHGSDQVL
jgi:hypothetical protein